MGKYAEYRQSLNRFRSNLSKENVRVEAIPDYIPTETEMRKSGVNMSQATNELRRLWEGRKRLEVTVYTPGFSDVTTVQGYYNERNNMRVLNREIEKFNREAPVYTAEYEKYGEHERGIKTPAQRLADLNRYKKAIKKKPTQWTDKERKIVKDHAANYNDYLYDHMTREEAEDVDNSYELRKDYEQAENVVIEQTYEPYNWEYEPEPTPQVNMPSPEPVQIEEPEIPEIEPEPEEEPEEEYEEEPEEYFEYNRFDDWYESPRQQRHNQVELDDAEMEVAISNLRDYIVDVINRVQDVVNAHELLRGIPHKRMVTYGLNAIDKLKALIFDEDALKQLANKFASNSQLTQQVEDGLVAFSESDWASANSGIQLVLSAFLGNLGVAGEYFANEADNFWND